MNLKFYTKSAFTLAEILITLGVIGVLASITLPTVIKHHQQQEVVSKLKKFHSIMNQAIRLSEAENGSCVNWDLPASGSNDDILEFYNIYLAKYIKSTDITKQEFLSNKNGAKRTSNLVQLSDGSAFILDEYSLNIEGRLALITFYPKVNRLNSDKFSRDRFPFELYKTNCTLEPYRYQWNKTPEHLKNSENYGCNKTSPYASYCTKLIEYNGWQITKDYPW